MKTLEDIQLAISVLPPREWLEMNRWVSHLALPHPAVVREASVVYGSTPGTDAIQTAVSKLDSYQLRELCEWLLPTDEDTAEPPSPDEDFSRLGDA